MKNIIQKLLLFFALTLTSTSVYAYDFKDDGLYYNILSEKDRTVKVTYYEFGDGNRDYVKGDLEIPKKAIYKSTTYSVTSIDDYAFNCCSGLTSVVIPNSVTSISDDAFYGCGSLTEINVEPENQNYTSDAGVLYSKDKTVLAKCPYGKAGDFIIPNSVTSIGSSAFISCRGLTSVVIPNSVTSIGEYAFSSCSGLTSVVIGESVTSIGDQAFYGCSGLTSVVIPNSVTSIGEYAFSGCRSLTSVVIPNSVTSIGYCVFYDCRGLTSVVIPDSVTTIGNHAFRDCDGLTSVVIGESVATIGSSAFYGCGSLTSVVIPNSVTTIGSYAFHGCGSLTSVVIPNSVTTIGSSAFSGCYGLTSVVIPNSVTSIGEYAFYGCYGLTSVVIPNSVTSIGDYAFIGCSSLNSIYCQWEKPIYSYCKFSDDQYKNVILYVPVGCVGSYEKVDPWRNFWEIKEGDYSGIEDVAEDGIDVRVVDGGIVVDSISNGDVIRIYSASGQCVYTGADPRVEGLAKGLYIVTVGRRSIKVLL